MLRQLKRTLVEMYIGTIALGWLLAEIVLQIVGIFSTPIASWVQRSEFGKIGGRVDVPTSFLLRDAGPAFVRSVMLLMIWYVLLRWLYIVPLDHENAKETTGPAPAIGSK